jgi:predicted RNase H-like HicB family nuclease
VASAVAPSAAAALGGVGRPLSQADGNSPPWRGAAGGVGAATTLTFQLQLPSNHRKLVNTFSMKLERFTAILEKEGNSYVVLCPELDVASQGATVEEAKANLIEAVELFLECADSDEIKQRLHRDLFITSIEVNTAA